MKKELDLAIEQYLELAMALGCWYEYDGPPAPWPHLTKKC